MIRKIFILLIFIFVCCTDNDESPKDVFKISMKLGAQSVDIPFVISPKKQQIDNRIWKKIIVKTEFKIGSLTDTLLYMPTTLKVDDNGNIYVLDMLDCAVKKFNIRGDYICKYGRKGNGPGEFVFPFRFDVCSDGKVIIIDPTLNKSEIYMGKNNYRISLSEPPISISMLGEGKFATLQLIDPISKSFIINYNITTNNKKEYENIIEIKKIKNKTLGMFPFLQGEICKYNKSNLVYIPMYMNFFVIYSSDGKILNAYNTIDNKRLTLLEKKTKSIENFRLSNEYISATNPSILGDNLIILSYCAQQKYNVPVVDVYSLKSGKYRFSFKINKINKYISIYIDSNRIYIIKENTVVEVLSYKIID